MRIFKLFSFVLVLMISCWSNAQQTIEMIAGLPKPPFIIDQQGKGIQLEIVREALSYENIDVKFIHMPFGRNITGYQRLMADAVMTVPPEYQYPALYLSKPYITYQNVAISLAEKAFTIESIADLSNKNITAFQNAKKFLGDEYGKTVAYSLDYREVHDQLQQIEMLYLRRTEVIILDINIFKYFIKHHNEELFNKPYTIHYIFDERPYSAGFRSKEMRDKFEQGIEVIKANGSYQQIIDNYLL